MILERVQRLAYRCEQNRIPGKFPSEFEKPRCSPSRTLPGVSFAHPPQQFLHPKRGGCRQSTFLQLLERRDLLLATPSFQALENRPPGSLGKYDLSGFQTPDLVEGFGENLNHMEPVHGYSGISEGRLGRRQKSW